MHMRNGLWSIVVGGVVGALLWTGPVGAQPFPGGLPECEASVDTCTSNLTQIQEQLHTCTTSLGTCTTDLGTCHTALVACQVEPKVVFPGDGWSDPWSGPRLKYHDNGDGTFTDGNTLLMWEVKVLGGDPDTCDLTTNLHGVRSLCTWAQATGEWIEAINAAKLGGYSDWRVPNIKELQSIVAYGTGNPRPSTIVPGETLRGRYWSSTRDAGIPENAWVVNFFEGIVFYEDRDNLYGVRAVRGGGQ